MTRRFTDGVLPVDKPEGPTSHDVVVMARRALGTRRIGHAGTLDPLASGLLLLCVGASTRLAEFLVGLPKRYVGTATLGVTTDTDDRGGRVLATSEGWRSLTFEDVAAAFARQTGERLQLPPVYSAKKVGGERLHEMARRGEAVAPEPAPITIYEINVTRYDPPDVDFEVTCSSGTYVRAIARDVGNELSCGAHLGALRRTAIGRFDVRDALPAAELDDADAVAAHLVSPVDALSHFPVIEADDETANRLAHGQAVPAMEGVESGTVVVTTRGELVAVGTVTEGRIRPRKVFRRAD